MEGSPRPGGLYTSSSTLHGRTLGRIQGRSDKQAYSVKASHL
jgi:hypothetical protein